MIKLNLDRLDSTPAIPGEPVQRPAMFGSFAGQIAVDRYLLQIGEPYGARVREAPRHRPPPFRPRPAPILERPRLIRGLIDRESEMAAIFAALDAGLPLEAFGDRGSGKTALLRHVAHHPRASSFADGIVYVSTRHRTADDVRQLLFEAFFESDTRVKPTERELQGALEHKQALILLDDSSLTQEDAERVLDCAPQSAFVVATRERRLWGETRCLAIEGLAVENAITLLEREMERPLTALERPVAERVCKALGGHPLRIQQAAAIARARGLSAGGWVREITRDGLIKELLESIDDKPRRALLALTALPGVPLEVHDISGIAELSDLEPSLLTLAQSGLVVRTSSRYHLADGVSDRLRRTDELNPWLNRAITYFTAWAERYRRNAGKLLEESEALLRAQHYAIETKRWGEALQLGQLVEGALAVGARWGAWGVVLDHCLTAAKALKDRSSEAWALHQLGTRALCRGEAALARALLTRAIQLRESENSTAGAAVSRRTLAMIPVPVPADVFDVGSLPLRPGGSPVSPTTPKRRLGAATSVMTMLTLAVATAAVYWATAGEPWRSWIAAGNAFLQQSVGTTPGSAVTPSSPVAARELTEEPLSLPSDGPPAQPVEPPTSVPEGASILIFTARPGSIALGGPTSLCYAVTGAFETTIEPGIGEVDPTDVLTCRRVAPRRTTTYELTAYSRYGRHARQRLVIVVR